MDVVALRACVLRRKHSGAAILKTTLVPSGHVLISCWNSMPCGLLAQRRALAKRKISASSFESLPYGTHPETGIIEQKSCACHDSLLCFGLEEVSVILMTDVDHISGIVATKQHPSPFERCDVVTTTMRKSMRCARAGMIFFNYSEAIPYVKKHIDVAVFRGVFLRTRGRCAQLRTPFLAQGTFVV